MADIYIEDDALRQGFTQIPNVILRRPDISPGSKLAYVMLLSYAWHKDSCFPGQDTLSEDMGVSNRSVVTYMKELQSVGLLIVKRRGLGLTNLYVLPRLTARSANIAPSEAKETTPPEVQNLHAKNMKGNNTQEKKTASKFRRAITPYIEDVAREFGDEAPLSSTLTRVVRILQDAGVSELDEAADFVQEACQITKERTHAIQKRTANGSSVFQIKNKVPYFLSVLDDLVEK